MKPFLTLTAILLACLSAQADISYTFSTTFPNNKDYHYTANSHIILAPGFKSQPINGHEVMFDIDSYGVFPPALGELGGPNPGDKGVVGSIEGKLDVGTLGAATYTIPLQVPEGLGGLKPNLSLCYNSQGKNGLLGWGWDLAGLSAITRTGKSLYYDSYVTPVNYNTDRFLIDGQHLLQVGGGSYGNNNVSYRTEEDALSNITSYTESGTNGTAYFIVRTSDGHTLYYGNTSDSKALKNSSNNIGAWLLKRVEDQYGNLMEYHYQQSANSYQLQKITYSGNNNDNIAPCFSVEFQYETRDDRELSYVGSTLYEKKDLLTRISIKNNNVEMYAYQFQYKKPNPGNGYSYHLLQEITFSAGDRHYNPTRIQWGGNNYPVTNSANVKMDVTTTGTYANFLNAVKFSGDFNGDGYTDVIATRPNADGSHTTAELYLNRGVTDKLSFEYLRSFSLNQNVSWIYVGDFDGNGMDDFLMAYRIRNPIPFPDRMSTELYLSRTTAAGDLAFNHYQTPFYNIPSSMHETLLIGSFFVPGQDVFLIQSVNEGIGGMRNSMLFEYDPQIDDIVMTTLTGHLDANRFFPADYNGDGLTEILYKKENGNTAIVRLSKTGGTPHYQELYNKATLSWDDCFPGDFNGDGLADVLLYKDNALAPWEIHLSSTLGLTNTAYPLPSTFPYTSLGDYHFSLDNPHHTSQFVKVGDFDGNGCADLALYHENKFHVYYGPIRSSDANAPFANHQQISSNTFGFYDNMGLCLGNFLGQEYASFLGGNTLSRIPAMTWRHEVKTLTDGMGRATALQYDYLMPNPRQPSEDDFYLNTSVNSNSQRNLYCTYVPLRALRQTSTTNVSGKSVVHRCQYEGAIVHRRGKGFIGFSKTRQFDYINNELQQTTVREYSCEPWCNNILMALTQEKVYDFDQHLMAQSTYDISVFTHKYNERVYILLADKTKEDYDPLNPNRLLKREIQKSTVNNYCSQIYEYDNVLSVISTELGITDNAQHHLPSHCEFQKTVTTSYAPNDLTRWLINKPLATSTRFHREGDYEDVVNLKVYTYNLEQPFQIQAITDYPNDGSLLYDPLITRTEYEYDLVGNIISQTIITPNDNLEERRETYSYNKEYGRLKLTKQTNAMGHTTTYTYDPVYGHCLTVTDHNGLVTQHERDPLGSDFTTHYPDGTVSHTALRWDEKDYLQWEKKTGQPTKITLYAPTGDVLKTTGYDLDGNPVSSTVEYDDLGREVKKSLPHKEGDPESFIHYAYSSHHQLSQIIHADGSYESLHYDGNQKSVTYHTRDEHTQTETKTFNAMGWLVTSTDAHGTSVVYDYYADGKPRWSQIEGLPETRVEMTYDNLRNRVSLIDPNYGTTSYQYNAFKELVRQVSPKQDQTDYTYDKIGNKVRCVETDHQTSSVSTTTWTYSNQPRRLGLLEKITSEHQTVLYEYDDLLRLTKTTDRCFGADHVTSYTYDKASRNLETTYPSGYTIRHCYSSEGVMRAIYDEHSNLLWKANAANSLGQPLQCTYGNGLVTQYEYDPSTQRLLGIHTQSDIATVQDERYEYDDFANMTRRTNTKNAWDERFTYDPLNRLTSVTDPEGTSEFHYDPLGRMTGKTLHGTTVFSNADYSGQRPYALKAADTHDGVFPEDRMNLSFTSFDKVATITEGNTNISFVYGFDHQRIQMTERFQGTIREKRYVDHGEIINPNGSHPIVRTFLYNPSGVFAVAETVDGVTSLHYIHKDHLGSWTVVTDERGTIEQENHFDAWGLLESEGPLMFDRGYTGHEHLMSVGLVNMNGRLYDPLTSSMLSPDNNIQMPDCTQNFNRYAYCLNNPLSYTDPDGQSFISVALHFYLLYCTNFGYELQKWTQFFAFHIDLHLSSQQIGIGFDVSLGAPKSWNLSWRCHFGVTYYWRFYDNSYSGWEIRGGAEYYFMGCAGISSTTFWTKQDKQTTNSIIIGGKLAQCTYENDYMFNITKELPGVVAADNGDRFRTAAAKIRVGPLYVGINIFTGDPGLKHEDRKTEFDANGRETYVINDNGDDPDQFRAGLIYIGAGPFRYGYNSEKIRHFLQNRFAHDFLCGGDTPYFKVLDRPGQHYFYFGTETGGTLW